MLHRVRCFTGCHASPGAMLLPGAMLHRVRCFTGCHASPGAMLHRVRCFTGCHASPGACFTGDAVPGDASPGAMLHRVMLYPVPCCTRCTCEHLTIRHNMDCAIVRIYLDIKTTCLDIKTTCLDIKTNRCSKDH